MSELINMRSSAQDVTTLNNLVDFVYQNAKSEKQLTMVEIGSYQGQSMEIFAKTGKLRTIICVDSWQPGYDSNDIASSSDMNAVECEFDRRLQQFDGSDVTILKHKGTIDTFINSDEFKKIYGNIDFVYIDACHTYDAVKHDIEMCQIHLKPAIAICGHDYVPGWSNVMKAVDAKLGRPDRTFPDGSYAKLTV